jgi:hypothetical protein
MSNALCCLHHGGSITARSPPLLLLALLRASCACTACSVLLPFVQCTLDQSLPPPNG